MKRRTEKKQANRYAREELRDRKRMRGYHAHHAVETSLAEVIRVYSQVDPQFLVFDEEDDEPESNWHNHDFSGAEFEEDYDRRRPYRGSFDTGEVP